MTSCDAGMVGRRTYEEMCGINYFWKEALWPWLIIWSRAGRQTGRGIPQGCSLLLSPLRSCASPHLRRMEPSCEFPS